MLTHRALERDVNQAMGKIEGLPTVLGSIVRLRLESLL
jgi:homoserine dehydrogenase